MVDASLEGVASCPLQISEIPDSEFEKAKTVSEKDLDHPILLGQGKNVPTVTDGHGNKLDSIPFDPNKHVIQPIAFSSKSLSSTQRQYSVIKLEALAIITALQQHEDILKGAKRVFSHFRFKPTSLHSKGSIKN